MTTIATVAGTLAYGDEPDADAIDERLALLGLRSRDTKARPPQG